MLYCLFFFLFLRKSHSPLSPHLMTVYAPCHMMRGPVRTGLSDSIMTRELANVLSSGMEAVGVMPIILHLWLHVRKGVAIW